MADNKSINNASEFVLEECRDFSIVLAEIEKYIKNQEQINSIIEAYNFSEEKHKLQKRHNGDPYIIHLISTAYFLAQWRMAPKTIIAGLLHDIIEDTPVSFDDIEDEFGLEVANLVESITKVSFFAKENRKAIKSTYLRKLYLSMVRDIRVIIIKIADRMHNMLTIQYLRPEKQRVIAKETLDIYSAIAHRIGMKTAKSHLEDLSFKVLEPEEYADIEELLKRDRDERFEIIESVINNLKTELKQKNGLENVIIFGRSKTIYSIYRKMKVFGKPFSDINDILAVRIITDTVDNCYRILGYIHQAYTPLSSRFKDYIATPKNNLYQSLHTTVSDNHGVIFEVQIRTEEMDIIAETGAAAHWRYKEGESVDVKQKQKELDEKIDIFTRILELEKLTIEKQDFSTINSDEYSSENLIEKTLQNDLFTASIYVLTPKGKVVTLPFGSTVLDFAYHIHSDTGDHATGAKINGVFSAINTMLNSGEMVEIITSAKQEPKISWLNIAKTNSAKSRIKKYLQSLEESQAESKKQEKNKLILKTREKINKYIQQHGLKWKISNDTEIIKKVDLLDYNSFDDFLLDIHSGEIPLKEAVEMVFLDSALTNDYSKINKLRSKKFIKNTSETDILVDGMDRIKTTIANCCLPIPGDEIEGFVSRTEGIKIHRKDCDNIKSEKAKKRLVSVTWNLVLTGIEQYNVRLNIVAFDRPALIFDISNVLSNLHSSVNNMSFNVDQSNNRFSGSIISVVNNQQMLSQIISAIKAIPNVEDVERY
ncbi:bifunctional (p)ppGpp synthetase/guanosine-3',5'-bis(diphosphate) 3'-pyrophosphohydrolase [Spiroplasma endosymbiont of Labia minor]|uniref:RelA/SpoT family protein n=1 Tax=Spiroplasma endosymbiont of Labia minor TaxID=3066305 RepID=UPI0030D3E914